MEANEIQKIYDRKREELAEQLTDALSNILLGEKIPLDVVNAETDEIMIPANRKITKTLLRKLANAYDHIEIDPSPIRNKIREIIGAYEHKFAELELERKKCYRKADDQRIADARQQRLPFGDDLTSSNSN